MKIIVTALSALLLIAISACASTTGDRVHWRPGDSKFTTGINAPAPIVEHSHR